MAMLAVVGEAPELPIVTPLAADAVEEPLEVPSSVRELPVGDTFNSPLTVNGLPLRAIVTVSP
jgi:hypothetical protein